jgi:predicted 2-oxoglutarate/Fe(II)-dependent dioxygenase YbiX
MDAGVREDAEVLAATIEPRVETRRASAIEIDSSLIDEVEARLDDERAAIERFFGVTLAEREGAGFLRYEEGGFYLPHRDRASISSWPDAARRLVAVVMFLNDDFEDGTLRLFLDASPVEVQPVAGLVVAFPAAVLHEVTAVRGGRRDAVVDWFYEPRTDDVKVAPFVLPD